MNYDPNKVVSIITPAKYVALVTRGKSGLTKAAMEIWYLDYKLLAVHKADDDNLADAQKCVGTMLSDRLIDHPNMGWMWKQFLPAMFPQIKAAGEEEEVHAEHCPGNLLVVDIEVKKGDPQYNEEEYINRVKGYAMFTGDSLDFREEIEEVMGKKKNTQQDKPEDKKAEEKPKGDDEFAGQF